MEIADYCIDSDILVDYLRAHEPARKFFLRTSNSRLFVSTVSIVEIYSGQSAKHEREKKRLDQWLTNFVAIPLDLKVARTAGVLRMEHRGPFADMIIAATALEYKLTLVTKNIKHFSGIAGLTVFTPY